MPVGTIKRFTTGKAAMIAAVSEWGFEPAVRSQAANPAGLPGICTNRDALHRAEEDIGNLRVALNALVRLFRM